MPFTILQINTEPGQIKIPSSGGTIVNISKTISIVIGQTPNFPPNYSFILEAGSSVPLSDGPVWAKTSSGIATALVLQGMLNVINAPTITPQIAGQLSVIQFTTTGLRTGNQTLLKTGENSYTLWGWGVSAITGVTTIKNAGVLNLTVTYKKPPFEVLLNPIDSIAVGHGNSSSYRPKGMVVQTAEVNWKKIQTTAVLTCFLIYVINN